MRQSHSHGFESIACARRLARTTARGLRAWRLAEEHGLALERQAEGHHRDHGPASWKCLQMNWKDNFSDDMSAEELEVLRKLLNDAAPANME